MLTSQIAAILNSAERRSRNTGSATNASGVRKNSDIPQSVFRYTTKKRAPSGGPIATMIWIIQTFSACEMLTPGFGPRDHVRITEADGTPRKKPDGSPEIRTILFPLSSATLYDVWDVIGLRGTGTDSYSVDNLFIPEKFAALRDEPSALREKGPLYKIPTNAIYSMGFAATSLGVARAQFDAAIDLSRKKTPQGLSAMKENSAVQGLIGLTEAKLRRARAYLFATAAEVWDDLVRGPFTEAHRVALRLAATSTIHQSTEIVDVAYHMAGATAVFRANGFERRLRDMHAINQQLQARDSHYEEMGKAILSGNLVGPPAAR